MVKKLFDFFVSILLLVVLFPVVVIISVLIKLTMGGDVIFKQVRPGKNAKLFKMYKFRTMLQEERCAGLSDEQRITKLGRWLRSTSLDELPELINVIKGDMSLVGPRPLLVDYLGKYTARQMRRHEVLPGITGLAQVRGRNELSWKNKFKYDVFYVDHARFMFDLKILCETVSTVFLKTGFKSHGEPNRFGE